MSVDSFSILWRIVGAAASYGGSNEINSMCFSILWRIVGAAVNGNSITIWNDDEFQYPLADRRGCGLSRYRSVHCLHAFQYPLADRRGCGNDYGVYGATDGSCFSILWRIVGAAVALDHQVALDRLFQYPLADRRGCGAQVVQCQRAWTVSVSSGGS